MFPYLFKIGDFPIRTFGLMVLLGVLAGSWWLGHALKKQGVSGNDPVGELATKLVIFGFIGARIMYLAVHTESYDNLLSLIAVWEGGLVSYGGFLGGAFGAWLFARKRRLPLMRLGDAILPGLALGQAFGRVGCLLVGDDHGKPWDGPWAITFPDVEGSLIPNYPVNVADPAQNLVGVPLHPSQIYLSLMNLALFLVAAWMFRRRRFDGQVTALVIGLYAVGRFLIEFTRGDYDARGMYTIGTSPELSTAQWISVGAVAVALVIFLRQRARPSARLSGSPA